jgi:rod shape-determining protein MreD
MSNSTLKQIGLFLLLVALQLVLLDKIHLFGYATPLIYIYFIIRLPGNMNRSLVLFLSALLGLSLDLFSYTLGINMLACVIIGFSRRFILNSFAPRDLHEDYDPSFHSFGKLLFLEYAVVMTLLHHLVLFSVESLSLFDFQALLFRVAGSAILTLSLVFTLESINANRYSLKK